MTHFLTSDEVRTVLSRGEGQFVELKSARTRKQDRRTTTELAAATGPPP